MAKGSKDVSTKMITIKGEKLSKADIIDPEWLVYGEPIMRSLIEEIDRGIIGVGQSAMALRHLQTNYKEGKHPYPTPEKLEEFIKSRIELTAKEGEAGIRARLILSDTSGIIESAHMPPSKRAKARAVQVSKQIIEIMDINRVLGDARYYMVVNDCYRLLMELDTTVLENRLLELKIGREEMSSLNQIRALGQAVAEALIARLTKEFKKVFGVKMFDTFSKMLSKALDGLDVKEIEDVADQKVKDFNKNPNILDEKEVD